MWDFLNQIHISPELGAFVALNLIFLSSFIYYFRESNKSHAQIAEIFDKRLESFRLSFQEITGNFQKQITHLDSRAYENQAHYQDQLATLVDSHLNVSTKSIEALSEIKGAFQGQAARLELLERKVSEVYGRLALEGEAKPKILIDQRGGS